MADARVVASRRHWPGGMRPFRGILDGRHSGPGQPDAGRVKKFSPGWVGARGRRFSGEIV